jgi:hypothetical protein
VYFVLTLSSLNVRITVMKGFSDGKHQALVLNDFKVDASIRKQTKKTASTQSARSA